MSISKRAFGVEGYKSTPRPEPTFEQIKEWIPQDNLLEVSLDKRKLKVKYTTKTIVFTLTEIDEAADQKKFVEDNIRRLL